jgi:hypothetical protein
LVSVRARSSSVAAFRFAMMMEAAVGRGRRGEEGGRSGKVSSERILLLLFGENEQLGTPLCCSSPSTIIQVELESCEVGDSVARLPNMKFNRPLPFCKASSTRAEIHDTSPVYEFPATRALRPTAYVLSTDLAHPDQEVQVLCLKYICPRR